MNRSTSRFSPLIVVLALLVILATAAYAWRRAQPSVPILPVQEVVDRGMTDEDRARFEARLADAVAQADAAEERDVFLLLQVGNAYYTLGRLGEAVAVYQDILSMNPNDAPALENMGQTLLEMGNYPAAFEAWQRAAAVSPDETTYIRMADLVRDYMPESRDAIRLLLEAAVANVGQTYALMVRLGDWYAGEGQYDRAVSHYEVALQLQDDPQARARMETYRQRMWESGTEAGE